MNRFILATSVLAVGLGLGAAAQAGPVPLDGSQGFNTSVTVPDGISPAIDLNSTGLVFTTLDLTTTGGAQTLNFVGVPAGTVVSGPLDTSNLAGYSIGSSSFGTFTANISGAQLLNSNDNRVFQFFGTFTPGTLFPAGAFVPTNAELDISFSQSGGEGNAISVEATLHTFGQPAGAPEPGSITLLGIGALGMGAVAFRRRQNKTAG